MHDTLLDRFKTLSGGERSTDDGQHQGSNRDNDGLPIDENDNKTIEELLADLGPTEQVSLSFYLKATSIKLEEENADL